MPSKQIFAIFSILRMLPKQVFIMFPILKMPSINVFAMFSILEMPYKQVCVMFSILEMPCKQVCVMFLILEMPCKHVFAMFPILEISFCLSAFFKGIFDRSDLRYSLCSFERKPSIHNFHNNIKVGDVYPQNRQQIVGKFESKPNHSHYWKVYCERINNSLLVAKP